MKPGSSFASNLQPTRFTSFQNHPVPLRFNSVFHFQRVNNTGYTSSSSAKEVKTPPTMGAAMRFMTSEPTPVEKRIGTSPNQAADTVISLGLKRLTAPASTDCSRSLD